MKKARAGGMLVVLGGVELAYLWAALAFLDARAAGGQLHTLRLLLLYAVGLGMGWGLGGVWRPLRYAMATAGVGLALLLATYLHFYIALPLLNARWLLSLVSAINPVATQEFPAQGVLLVMGLVLAWRGWVLYGIRTDADAFLARFQFGAVVFLLAFLAASQLQIESGPWLPAVFVFMAMSLGGMGLVRAGGGGGWEQMSVVLGGMVAVAISMVMLGGLAVAVWLTPEVLRWPLLALKALGALLMAAVDWLMNLLPYSSQPPEMPAGIPPGEIARAESEVVRLLVMPEWLRRLLRGMFSVVWIGLFLAALASISVQVWGRMRRGLDRDAEPLPGAFSSDLRRAWRWLLSAMLRRRGTVPESPHPPSRLVYRRLLHRCARAGWPRPLTQTPTEYQAMLALALPSGQDDLAAITEAYLRARYGPQPTELEESRLLWERWRSLRPLLKRRRLPVAP